ncbi:MAG: response regulator [Chlorobi bacterium]|nr:response regulator [Chlorobiota bacterium]
MAKNILIVDDSESIREVVSFTLENAGNNIDKAIDGVDALKFLEKNNYDLIITDLHMPNMDGIDLIKEVRKMEKHKFIPILFLTTESQTEKKMLAKAAGATGWIVKPFVPEKLLMAVNKVVR